MYEEIFQVSQSMFLNEETHVIMGNDLTDGSSFFLRWQFSGAWNFPHLWVVHNFFGEQELMQEFFLSKIGPG